MAVGCCHHPDRVVQRCRQGRADSAHFRRGSGLWMGSPGRHRRRACRRCDGDNGVGCCGCCGLHRDGEWHSRRDQGLRERPTRWRAHDCVAAWSDGWCTTRRCRARLRCCPGCVLAGGLWLCAGWVCSGGAWRDWSSPSRRRVGLGALCAVVRRPHICLSGSRFAEASDEVRNVAPLLAACRAVGSSRGPHGRLGGGRDVWCLSLAPARLRLGGAREPVSTFRPRPSPDPHLSDVRRVEVVLSVCGK